VEVVKRFSEEVVAFEAHGERVEQSLAEPDRQRLGCGLFEQQKAATRSEHALCLGDGGAVVRDSAQRQGADDGVEALVGKLERLCVADAQVDRGG